MPHGGDPCNIFALHNFQFDAVIRALHGVGHRAALRESRPFRMVFCIVLPGGRLKYVRQAGVVQFEAGCPVRSTGTLQDVTDIRIAQLALEEMAVIR